MTWDVHPNIYVAVHTWHHHHHHHQQPTIHHQHSTPKTHTHSEQNPRQTKQNPNPRRANPDPQRANPRQTNSEQTMSKPKTTNPNRNHRNTRPTHWNPDRKLKIINPTTTQIGQPPLLKPKSQPTDQNLNLPAKILTHYTQITRPTTDPQPLQSTAKKSRERVQERIKKKEEWEKKVRKETTATTTNLSFTTHTRGRCRSDLGFIFSF